MNIQMYNTHLHVFTFDDVPREFLPLGIVRLLAKRCITRTITRWLHRFLPFNDSDMFDRYARFLEIGTKTTAEIFSAEMNYYPIGSSFVLLSMDMSMMGAGSIPRPYEKQLDDLVQLKLVYGDLVLPFLCVDPRNPLITLDFVKRYIEEKHFHGLKIYPALGYFPYDQRLYDIYRYAEVNEIPVISHTSPGGGGTHYRGKITDSMRNQSRVKDIIINENMKTRPWSYFSHPLHYGVLLTDFPKLKVSLAHFGGDDEWRLFLNDTLNINSNAAELRQRCWLSIIITMLKQYPTLYTDISYTAGNMQNRSLLKVLLQDSELRGKILFGSDFYMAQIEASERAFSIDLRAFLGDNDFQQIAVTNPKSFL
jgi:predicted TIM-barrel fold metal-dependent hydrolase